VISVVGFVIVLVTSNGIFITNPSYAQLLGWMSVMTESLLGIPQLIRNFRKKSTEGLSIAMVSLWSVSDIAKTVVFVRRKAPRQFVACGSTQIFIDLLILIQVQCYRHSSRMQKRDNQIEVGTKS